MSTQNGKTCFIIIDEDYDYSPSMILGYTDTREEAEKIVELYNKEIEDRQSEYTRWQYNKPEHMTWAEYSNNNPSPPWESCRSYYIHEIGKLNAKN